MKDFLKIWLISAFTIAVFMMCIQYLFTVHAHTQPGPAVTASYGLSFYRYDWPPATAGQTSFQTPASQSKFVLVYINGVLGRACGVGTQPSPGVCDYTLSNDVLVTTYPLEAGDLVTELFFR